MPKPKKVEARFSNGNWELVWKDIGEGLSGDYNPSDPTDVPLLRATLLYKGYQTADGSYCTATKVGTPTETLKALSEELFSKLPKELDTSMREGAAEDRGQEWHFNDRIMQEWTWLRYADKKANA
jgi:hypothetical protein